MSVSKSDQELIEYLERISSEINLYCGSVIFIIGCIGNLLNVVILSQRTFRSNPCIIIFISSSITGLIAILSGVPSRILYGRNLDLSETIQWLCKCRVFLLYTFRSVTFWLIMLATIDRWLVSSPNVRFRRLSSIKNVFRTIFSIVLLTMILHGHLFYCFEANLSHTPLKCFNNNSVCRLITDLIFAIISIVLPLILTLIFGWMTIRNIRLSQIRIDMVIGTGSNNNTLSTRNKQRQFKRTDRHLFLMLFIQVILFACLTLPLSIEKLHATLTINIVKSKLRSKVEDFIYQVTLLLVNIVAGMQFYINIFTGGRIFRKAFLNLFQSMIRKVMCR